MIEYCEDEGKIKFKSQQDAYTRGRKLAKHRGGNVRAYKCSFCNCYHLTAQQDRYKKRRRLHRKGK